MDYLFQLGHFQAGDYAVEYVLVVLQEAALAVEASDGTVHVVDDGVGYFVVFRGDDENAFGGIKACILGTAVAIVLKIVTGSIAGSASTLINMGGQIAGFISPVIMGYLVYAFNGSFNAVFYYLMGVAALCAVSAFLIPKRTEDMLDVGEDE